MGHAGYLTTGTDNSLRLLAIESPPAGAASHSLTFEGKVGDTPDAHHFGAWVLKAAEPFPATGPITPGGSHDISYPTDRTRIACYRWIFYLTTSQFVKYARSVHIVTRKHLKEAAESYQDAADEIAAWTAIVEAVRWHNFPEVRSTFTDADCVDNYVIFDIRQNRYRLITVIHYAKTTAEKRTEGHVYIRSFLTHKEYNNRSNWDRRYGTK